MKGKEILFAQRLADNEKRVRDKTIKKLKKYLSVRSSAGPGFSDDDALKLWKGLFYCMYMADKPLVQEDLADEISFLIHDLNNAEDSLCFIKAAFQTFSREWNGIDVFRINKFMMFIRRVLRQVFVFLRRYAWDVRTVVSVVEVLEESVVCPTDDVNKTPLGLKLHVCDVILEELAKVGGEKLQHRVILAILQPYFKVLGLTQIVTFRSRVSEGIIRHLIRQSDVGIAYEEGRSLPVAMGDEESEGEHEDEGVEYEEEEKSEPVATVEENEAENEGEHESESEGEHESESEDEQEAESEDEQEAESEDEQEAEDEGEHNAESEGEREADMQSDDESEEDMELDPRAGLVDVFIPQLRPNFRSLADTLQNIGAVGKISKVNRELIYQLVTELQDVAEGCYPYAVPEEYVDDDVDVPEEEEERAIERLQKFHERLGSSAAVGDEEEDQALPSTDKPLSKKKLKRNKKSEKKIQKQAGKTAAQQKLSKTKKKQRAEAELKAEEARKRSVESRVLEVGSGVGRLPFPVNNAVLPKASTAETKRPEMVNGFEVSPVTQKNKNGTTRRTPKASWVRNFSEEPITPEVVGKKRKKMKDTQLPIKRRKSSGFMVSDLQLQLQGQDSGVLNPPDKMKTSSSKRESDIASVDCALRTESVPDGVTSKNKTAVCNGQRASKPATSHKKCTALETNREKVNGIAGEKPVAVENTSENAMTEKITVQAKTPSKESTVQPQSDEKKVEPTVASVEKAATATAKKTIEKKAKVTAENTIHSKPDKKAVKPTVDGTEKPVASKKSVSSGDAVPNSVNSLCNGGMASDPESSAKKTTNPDDKEHKINHNVGAKSATPDNTKDNQVIKNTEEKAKTFVANSTAPSNSDRKKVKKNKHPDKQKLKATVDASATSNTPVKSALAKNKNVGKKFSQNNVNRLRNGVGGSSASPWNQPLQDGEIEIFIKSKQQIKKEKLQARTAKSSLKKVLKKGSMKGYSVNSNKSRTINIDLKKNKEHEFSDYARTLRASPKIPFNSTLQPKAPVLKPTSSPILVKKPLLKKITTVASSASPKFKKGNRLKAVDFF